MSRRGISKVGNTSRDGKRPIRDEGNGWEGWGGYMAAKMQKLEDQYTKDTAKGDNPNIFKGVAIYVNGYTKPSSDELKRLITSHGGQYEHYLYKTRVTHIIATNLPYSKIRDLKTSKVVKPEWITDSVKAGRLLSYIPYLLYTAQGGRQQGIDNFASFPGVQDTNMADIPMNMSAGDNSTTSCHRLENVKFNSAQSNENRLLSNIVVQKLSNTSDIPQVQKNMSSSAENDSSILKSSVMHDDIMMIDHQNEQQTNISNKSPSKPGNTTFLNEFYSNSRLHHLSTWKSEWRDYVNRLQKAGSDFPGRKRLMEFMSENSLKTCMLGTDTSKANFTNVGSGTSSGKPVRVVMHIDMDCFFVSVGLRKRPELRGKPVAVTHSRGQGQKNPTPGSDINFEQQQWELRRQQGGKKGKETKQNVQTGGRMLENIDEDASEEEPDLVKEKSVDNFHSMAEIASCSYEARQAGVRNGMFMGKARKLCPDLKTIPYDFEGYQEVSKLLYDTVASYTHDIEAVSCDEMMVDCTDVLATTGAGPLDFACLLRQELYEKTGCPASAGMGSNILLAKMATRKAKPNGQFYLEPADTLNFIAEQTIQNIPGVGWSMSRKLKLMKIETCGDLQKLSLSVLQKEFGTKTGQSLYNYARGQDDRPIKVEQERKSVSAEVNYGIRFQHDGDAEKFMLELSEEVHNRLKNIDRKGRSVTLKVMVRRQDAPVQTAKFMGHGICNNISKSVMLPIATDDPKVINRECLLLLRSMKVKASDLRGVGIQMHRLETSVLGPPGFKQGTQSILNFMVNREISPKKKTEVGKTSNTAVQELESALKDTARQFITSTTECETSSALTSGTADITVVSPPVTNPTSTIENAVVIENLTSTENRSDEDDFLGGYCHNIVDELSRRRTAKRFIPPLPTLPDISGSPEVTVMAGSSEMSSAPDYFPSPSQIDPEVLSELPEDIRKQIETEIIKRKPVLQKHPKESHGVSTTGQPKFFQDAQPGCSHFPYQQEAHPGCSYFPDQQEALAGCSHFPDQQEAHPGCSHFPDQQEAHPGCSYFINGHQQDEIVSLPSPSRLDESCLNALPEEMQREIRAAYADQETSHPRKSTIAPPLKQTLSPPKQHESPGKSPAKNKQNSPVFKVPRGKPGHGRPKKLNFQSPKQPKLTAALKSQQPQKTEKAVNEVTEVIELDSDADSLAAIITEEEMYQHSEIPSCHGDSVRSAVNLCGAVRITEVRAILREWLLSTQVPEQDDEDVLVNYLCDLALDHNLERVDLVIKFLQRNIQRFKMTKWTSALDRIVEKTQEAVKTVYGCKLKLLFQSQ